MTAPVDGDNPFEALSADDPGDMLMFQVVEERRPSRD